VSAEISTSDPIGTSSGSTSEITLNETPSYREIWKISIPIILSLLAQNLINVIDTAFLGRVGEVELGASAIAGLFYITLFMLGNGFGTGAQILIARRDGEGRKNDIGKIFDQGLYFLVVLAIVLLLVIKVLSPLILGKFITSAAVAKACVEFLRYRIWGLVFAFIIVNFRAFYIGIARTRILTYGAVIMAIVNILLDYLLIFGNFGFPRMGIAGAGLASTIAEACAVVFYFLFTLKTVDLRLYSMFRFSRPDFKVIKKTLDISVFIMFQFFASLGAWFIFFVIIEKMGERPLAISNIIRSAYLIMMMPIWALGSATNTLVSNAIGAGKSDTVIKIIRKITWASSSLMIIVIFISLLLPRFIISIYTNNSSLINDTLPSLHVILGALFLFSAVQIMFSGVSGTANTNVALGIELGTLVIYLFSTWLIAIHWHQPIEVVWTCEYVYFFFLGIFSYFYLRWGNWRAKVI
jgi:putative MATE family efflux protein